MAMKFDLPHYLHTSLALALSTAVAGSASAVYTCE